MEPSVEDTIAAGPNGVTRPLRGGAELSAGDVVGRYVVLSKLGAGGMGVVYAGYDPELDRKVALKLLHSDSSVGSMHTEGRSRLIREAQALAKFSHPEIVAVHDVGEHEGSVWLAMEFVDGRTFGDWAKQSRRTWKEVLGIMLAAGRGVAAAHAAGLVHRDLKPENIMVAHDGRVRVMDFGLTRPHGELSLAKPGESSTRPHHEALASTLTQHGSLLGTPGYMAPEQFAGEPVSAATDQFAYCVTMWELLYGDRPFAGRSVMELASAVLAGELRPAPSDRRVPSWLRRACERGLSRQPAARWPSMHVLLSELGHGQSRALGRWIAIGVLALGLVVVVGEFARRWAVSQRVASCEADGDTIDQVWNDSSRARVREGLVATTVSYAETTADKVMPYLDAEAEAWREHRAAACMNAQVRETWDAATLDRAVWCLDERRLEFEALVTELGRADASVVQSAVAAAAGLQRIAPCVDDSNLRMMPEPPTGESRAAVGEVRAQLALAGTLHAAGKYGEGLEVVGPAREQAEGLGWPPLVVAARRREGALLRRSGRYPEAEAMSISAYMLAARSDLWDVAADAASDLIETVGDLQVRHVEGRDWGMFAAIAIDRAGDPLGFREATRATRLGHIALGAADYTDAEQLYTRALEIRSTALGADHPTLASALNNLGNVHRARGEPESARDFYERALALHEAALGPNHPDVAGSLNNLAVVLDALGEHERARVLLERALSIWLAALGPDHPSVAIVLTTLGNSWTSDGDATRASHYYERALASMENALGPDHPDVATVLNNLGGARLSQRDPAGAKVMHLRALAIREKAYAPDHPSVANSRFNLAQTHQALGENTEAKRLLEAALASWERTFGPDHPEVAWCLSVLGEVELALDQADEAVVTLERAIVIFDASDGVQGGEVEARFALARTLVTSGGDRARAIAQAKQAREAYLGPWPEIDAWLAGQERR